MGPWRKSCSTRPRAGFRAGKGKPPRFPGPPCRPRLRRRRLNPRGRTRPPCRTRRPRPASALLGRRSAGRMWSSWDRRRKGKRRPRHWCRDTPRCADQGPSCPCLRPKSQSGRLRRRAGVNCFRFVPVGLNRNAAPAPRPAVLSSGEPIRTLGPTEATAEPNPVESAG